MSDTHCPFCLIASGDSGTELIAESSNSVAFFDSYPISEGHTLLIPKKHEVNFFNLSEDERADIWGLVNTVQKILNDMLNPDGFNIGANVLEAAGQTIMHAHVHIIPRFSGDIKDPRGGVRWVIPEKAPYWE